MEVAIILICATLMGGFFMGFFLLGMKYEQSKKKEDTIELTEDNKDALLRLTQWLNYGGKNNE